MVRRCLAGCGRLVASGSYCPEHRQGTGWGNRDRTAQARFRRGLVKRAGNRCEAIVYTQGRCTTTTDLRACHIVPLHKGGGYDLSNGVLLCRAHDKATDRYAR